MTLRRKMTLQIGAMLVGLLLVSAAALWGLNGLRSDFGIASAGYRELREMYEAASHVATARALLAAGDRDPAAREINTALTKLDVATSREESPSALRLSPDGPRLVAGFRDSIRQAAAQLKLPPDDQAFHSSQAAANDAINQSLGQVTAIAMSIRKTISDREQAANLKWKTTITLVGGVSLAVVLGAVVLGIYQYRSVITPLRRIGDAARKIAAGRFSDRLEPRGSAEFAALAVDFNRMAGELESLYRELEQKVAIKSKELVRSERLASVGYLAAGVAHEINNPLGIITGYGERAIQQLERGASDAATAIALKNLRIMCEEAYRCTAITDELLSLARPGDEARKPVSLAKLSAEVVALIEGLPAHRNSKLSLRGADVEAIVLAKEGELKQVVLNLAVNALEAVQPGSGEVTISIEQSDDLAKLIVTDNGRGMSPETLERIFEPFFTDKRGAQVAGTGLGLSISHAIVESHGGHLRAFSDGPGHGSRFVVELPLYVPIRQGVLA